MNLGSWVPVLMGAIVFIIGIILFPTPAPLGAPLLVIGLVMMLGASKRLRNEFRRLRRRYPQMVGFFRTVLRWRHRFGFSRRRPRRFGVPSRRTGHPPHGRTHP